MSSHATGPAVLRYASEVTVVSRQTVRARGPLASHRVIALVCALALSGVNTSAHAHFPHDPVLALGVSPDFENDRTLFVATFPELNWSNRDILRSTDGGKAWGKLPNGMDNRFDFSSIRVSPNFTVDHAVFAATRGDGIYRSLDSGDHWILSNAGLINLNVKDLKIGKLSNTAYTLFAAVSPGGIYRRASSDNTWAQVLSPSVSVNVIATSPDYAADSTVMTTDMTGRLRMSNDAGNTWTDLGSPAGAIIYDIAIAPGNSKEIFLAAAHNLIFYSSDSGRTFVNKGANLPLESINNISVSPNYLIDHTVFCTGVTRSVYKSTDSGNSWTLYTSGAAITHQTAAVNEFSELQVSNTFASDHAVFMSAFDGLFISTTGGITWVQSQTRAKLTPGLALSPNFANDQSVLATSYYGAGIAFSGNGGSQWEIRSRGWPTPAVSNPSFAIDFVQNHVGPPMAVATKNFSYIGFSSDFGAAWQMKQIPDLPAIFPGPVYPTVLGLSPAFDTDGEIYLGTIAHGVIQSLDGGATWRANRGVPNLVTVTSLAVSPNYATDHIAFAGDLGQVWLTTNGGGSWVRTGTGSIVMRSGLKYTWIAVSPSFATDHLLLVGSNNGVYSSIDSGNTFQAIGPSEIGPATIIRQIAFSPNFGADRTVFVNVRGRGLYRVLLDAIGKVSSLQNVGVQLLESNIEFTDLRFSPTFKQDNTLMGASGGAVYRSADGGLTWAFAGSPNN